MTATKPVLAFGESATGHTVEPDVHMERGGPDGAIAVFNLYAPDGLLTDVLADDHSVIRTNTVEQVVEAWRRPVAVKLSRG